MQMKRLRNDWKWNQPAHNHMGVVLLVSLVVLESGREGGRGTMWGCERVSSHVRCTARRSHEKSLLGDVACFLSVKSDKGNIQKIFRQAASWWWWTLEVAQWGNHVYCIKDFMLRTLLFIGVCIVCMSGVLIQPDYSLFAKERGSQAKTVFWNK